MKIFSLFLLLLSSLSLTSHYKYLKLENGQIKFEKIYTLDSLSSTEIEDALLSNLPKFKKFNLTTNLQGKIIGKIEGSRVDVTQYGGRRMSESAFLGYPFL